MSAYNLRERTRCVDYSESALAQRLSLPDHSVVDGLGTDICSSLSAQQPKKRRGSPAKRKPKKRRLAETSSLNDLPDDCLLHIFSKVQGIREKLRLGRGQ